MSSFSFLNPGFLWALPVAAIPILIHFLSKRRLPEVRFPTVMFLRAREPRVGPRPPRADGAAGRGDLVSGTDGGRVRAGAAVSWKNDAPFPRDLRHRGFPGEQLHARSARQARGDLAIGGAGVPPAAR